MPSGKNGILKILLFASPIKKLQLSDLPPKDVFTREITITGNVDEAQRARMIVIANKCPVHKTLEASSEIETHEA